MRRIRGPKDRHAKVNFNNWGSPPVGLPGGASPVTFVKDTQGNIQAYAEVTGSEIINNVSIESELWAPPATADAFDDEFTSSALSGNWTLYDSDGSTVITPSGSINPYDVTTSGARVQTNTYWRSWLVAQIANDNAANYLMKSITPNTNDVFWARMGHTLRPVTNTSDSTIALLLMAATAGHPDPANRIGVWWVPDAVGGGTDYFKTRMFAHKTTGGVGVDVYVPAVYITHNAYAKGTYFVVAKRGTVYDFWILDGIGTRYWLGQTTYAPTIAYAGFLFNDNTSTGGTGGNAIFSADFIRRVQNNTAFLP